MIDDCSIFYRKLTIYCLDGSTAKKFTVDIPGVHNYSANKLKAFLFQNKKIPLECQTLFICDQESGMFEHIDGDASLDCLKAEKKTIHMYMKKSAQTRSLENVRKSDFEAWYEQYKQNKNEPTYQGKSYIILLCNYMSSNSRKPNFKTLKIVFSAKKALGSIFFKCNTQPYFCTK